MEKVVLLLRVSTNIQDYEYQRSTLTELCEKRAWEIVHTFENKVSGAKKNEERKEIVELLDYVKNNEVDKVVCTEISRLGRSTLEALKTIEILNEQGVCLYLANYGLETLDKNGKINPLTSLICTILLEIGQMERGLIRTRMSLGYADYITKRKLNKDAHPVGRPSSYRKSDAQYKEQYSKEISLIRKGISLRNISKLTGVSINTLRKLQSFV